MSQALYRKYRSKSLSEVVGQEHVTTVLGRALEKDLVSHAYLLTGPRGVGKTSIARILAHEINAIPYDGSDHLDIIEIDAASNNGVEDIRDLREKVSLAPVSAKKKIYIIDEVHMLSKPAFNALLKTLEEPPEHVVFILATTEVHKLPDTILSRTQRFHFRSIDKAKMIAHLQSIAKQEKIDIDDNALSLIATRAKGSFRDAISLLDQLRHSSEGAVTEKEVTLALGIGDSESINGIYEALVTQDSKKLVSILHQLEELGVSPVILSEQINQKLKESIDAYPDAIAVMEKLIEVGRSFDPQLKLFAILMSVTQSAPQKTSKNVAQSATTFSITKEIDEVTKKKPTSKSTPKETTEKHNISAESSDHKKVVESGGLIKDFDWAKMLEYIRTNHLPLHSVVHKSVTTYENGVLNLHFTYAIHKKKLDDGKYRQMLTTALIDVYTSCPEITTSSGKLPPKNEHAKAVAAIMGGGEEVSLQDG